MYYLLLLISNSKTKTTRRDYGCQIHVLSPFTDLEMGCRTCHLVHCRETYQILSLISGG